MTTGEFFKILNQYASSDCGTIIAEYFPGRTVGVPATKPANATTSTPNRSSLIYTVQEGDTLWSTANRFNVTVEAIKQVNQLSSDNIRTGQTLVIPRP